MTGSLTSLRAGLIALVSLIAFYATTATIWHAVNVHTVRNNAFFVIAGTGFCAVLGFVVARVVRSVRAAFLVTGFFLFLEPLASLAYGRSIGVVTGTSMTVGLVESVVGLVVMIASRPRSAGTPS